MKENYLFNTDLKKKWDSSCFFRGFLSILLSFFIYRRWSASCLWTWQIRFVGDIIHLGKFISEIDFFRIDLDKSKLLVDFAPSRRIVFALASVAFSYGYSLMLNRL